MDSACTTKPPVSVAGEGFAGLVINRKATAFDPVPSLLRLTGPRPRILVAFSGGMDSTVLAHALVRARRRLGSLRLAHVDHGLQPASGEWSRQCARQARTWRVPLANLKASIAKRRGESPEAAAREARYALLARELAPGEVLVTAQHREDQVETLLLQLVRGAGVTGLASMPRYAPFASGHIARPLLDCPRSELLDYARRFRLTWVEDPTNQQQQFGRNYLRHRVLPLLRERWAGVDVAIARTARHMAEAGELLEESARRDLHAVSDGGGVNVAALRRLSPARRRNVLRAFIARAGLELPSAAQMAEMAGPLLSSRADAQPQVRWPGAALRRRAGRLELQVKSEHAANRQSKNAFQSWNWAQQRELILNDGAGRLEIVEDAAGAIDLERLPRVLELHPRQGGESLRPGPRARTQSLKKLLQGARLSIEQRARLPLLFSAGAAGRLIVAGDRWIDASVLANVKSRRRARLIWKKETDRADFW